jgi:3',5'-cyclic AMP phosphodiesterase CpdA
MLAILHITDLHFGKQAEEIFPDKLDLAKSIAAAVVTNCRGTERKVLIVSGDLVYNGNSGAYYQAKVFIEDLCKAWGAQAEETLICPGNHDIVHSQSDVFAPINTITYDLTHRESRTFINKTSICVNTPEADFLVINSAFRRDHKYGSVDIEHLAKFNNSAKPRIAVLHHNLIGICESDTSTIRNAYPVLHEFNRNRILLVLHGHQHMLEDLSFGKPPCRTIGAGSLNFRSPNATQNQFNLILLRGKTPKIFRYIWSPDAVAPGRLGAWNVFSPLR